mmetsp:Transcript_77563/g.179818  ORF Transcript_77563/g.179818 Transcript_77563/m.179818 type:complete len:311 (+) Transcript_77563:31-963(+)
MLSSALAFIVVVHAACLQQNDAEVGRLTTEAEVVLVQGTNLPLPTGREEKDLAGIPRLEHPEWLSSALVSEYARMHGYAHRIYLYKAPYEAACEHPKRGPLKAQWCKILALRVAFQDFPRARTIVWLDTDVFLMNMATTIDQVMENTKTVRFQPITDNSTCTEEEPPLGRDNVSVFTWKNSLWDGGCGVCTGAMIFRRTAATAEFLEQWWDNAMGPKIPGPYDQGFFARMLYYDHPDKVAVFNEDSFHMARDGGFLVHRLKKAKWLLQLPDLYRTAVMQQRLIKPAGSMLAAALTNLDRQISGTAPATAT